MYTDHTGLNPSEFHVSHRRWVSTDINSVQAWSIKQKVLKAASYRSQIPILLFRDYDYSLVAMKDALRTLAKGLSHELGQFFLGIAELPVHLPS